MNIQHNYNLKTETTFGVEVYARYFCSCLTIEDLRTALDFARKKEIEFLVLGGGSNMLFTKDFDGLVIKLALTGVEIVSENEEEVIVKAQAGVTWHELVLFSIRHKLFGIENLSLIPGSVGAAPMQNIGAYGVEIKEVFHELEALKLETGELITMNNSECNFDYRYSIFKGRLKDKFIILSVSLKLEKNGMVNTSYGAISAKLMEMGISNPSPKDVSNAVIAIRRSKLPDPKEIGNAGSFFKNPIISNAHFQAITSKHADCPHYKINEKYVKVPAGYLIEQCGWKGKRIGDAGVHKNQALVLVNYGNASGTELLKLSQDIQASVKDEFDISLEREVNVI